jgi:choice-of-anchor A domain-containing protein
VAQGIAASTSGLTLGGGVSGSVYGSNYTAALSLNNTAGSVTATSAGTKVLNLTDLILSGTGAILTLNGNGVAGAVNYVINVNRYLTLGTAAQIQLGGALTPQNVLFNVKSNATQYDVTLSGGALLNGILLAPTRTVKLSGASVVNGEVIAKGVSLSGRSQVINPTVSQ